MKLDRNDNADGLGKYALLNLRKLSEYESGKPFERWTPEIQRAIDLLNKEGVIQWGITHTEDEFFVIKLRDRHAKPALLAYAGSIALDDTEFATEVLEMASRAGADSKFCKDPD